MNDQGATEYRRVVIERVLNTEGNSTRFEYFCNEIVSLLEGGAPILSTSKSWDQQRDGVGFGKAKGIIVCTSLNDDPDNKALNDLEELVEKAGRTRPISQVFFCSSQPLSDHGEDSIQEALHEFIDHKFPVVCLGSGKLSQVANSNMETFERFYAQEYGEVVRVTEADPTDSTELRGLRLALMSTAADNSQSIREEVYATAILEVLSDGAVRTPTTVAKDMSDHMSLHRSVGTAVISPHLRRLERAGHITFQELIQITPVGREHLEAMRKAAVGKFVEMRRSIRDWIETAIGEKIIDDDFHRIWVQFEEKTSHYMQWRGETLVAEVASLLDDDAESDQPTAQSMIDELATAVGKTSAHPQRREELAQAIRDLFADREGPASEWLVRTASHFVAACAMGLEQTSSSAITKLFKRTRLLLDTDVVLTLLCEAEVDHHAVADLVGRWRKAGGKVLVPEPVLEEAAKHAWNAGVDYERVAHLVPGTREDRLRLISNAFVRTFAELVDKGTLKVHQWKSYIEQYAGTSDYDWNPVYQTLSADLGVERLPKRDLASAAFEAEVREYLVQQAQENLALDPYAEDKARRDATLYVAVLDHLAKLKEQDPATACLVVSSAKRLQEVERQFRRTGEPQLVVSIGAALYIVALLPDVQLGLTAMKSFLFDEQRYRFSSDLERSLLRLVRGTTQVALPQAKRGVLMRVLRQKLVKDATERGERPTEQSVRRLEREAMLGANEKRTMTLLSEALEEVGLGTREKGEVKKLRDRVAELERQLEQERKKVV